MDNYTRNIFGFHCPYTDILCISDVDCADCEINQEELKKLQEDEYQE